MRSDFSKRHPWRAGLLTGLGIALGMTIGDVIAGETWDAVAFGAGAGLVSAVVLAVLVRLAARPRRRE